MNRNIVIFIIALFALSGSAISALASIADRDYQLRGYENPIQNTDLPFRVPRLGVNADLTQYSEDELRFQLGLMEQAHINWIRQEFRWDEIEYQQGEYDWQIWDEIVNSVNQFDNLQLVAVLINSPEWARHPDGETATAPPENHIHFGEFIVEFTSRYSENIDYYQIWDEPNLAVGWGELAPSTIHYGAMLQVAYNAIHSNDSQATVITAGIAPTVETTPLTINDLEFLEELYSHDLDDYFDAVAGKPYGYNHEPYDRAVENDILNFSRVIHLREIMVANGDGHKAVWASHWGWNSLPSDWSGAVSVWGQVTQQQQLEYTTQALGRIEREWTWLAGAILHHWQPDSELNDPIWGFALIDSENQPTPLWQTLVDRPTQTHATNGLFAPQNPYANYSGIWTFSELGADIGWVEDSQLTFDFSGEDVALLLRQDDYVANLYPTIDNQPANRLPQDNAGNSYIAMTSHSLQPEITLVPVSIRLDNTTHQLSLIADELIPTDSQDRWALVGYAVSSGNLATPYNRQITIAWVTSIVAGISVIISGWRINWTPIKQKLSQLVRPLSRISQLGLSGIASITLMLGLLLTWGESTPQFFRRESVQFVIAIFTAGLLQLNPALIVSIITSFILFIIIFNHIGIGLTLIIFWAPFFLFPVELYQFAFPMVEVILLITVSAWVLKLSINTSKWIKSDTKENLLNLKLLPMDYLVIAWVFLGFLSILWTERTNLAITELRTLIIEPALFYLLIRTTSLTKKQLNQLVIALVLAGITVAVFSLLQFTRGETIITAEDGARRLAGIYGSPNNLGLFLGRCIPFAFAFLLIEKNRTRRFIALLGLGVISIVTLLSQSVGALFIGIPASLIAIILLQYRQKAIIPISILGILGMIIVGILLQQPRFARVLTFTEGTNFYRLRVWESSLQMIEDHPLTGIGLDQFLYEYRGHYIIPDAWEEPNLSHPHNILLDFWTRLGLIGVGILISIQAIFWRSTLIFYNKIYTTPSMVERILVIGLMGSMINLLAHGLVDNSVYVIDLAYVFAFTLAISVVLTNISAIDDFP